MIDQNDRGYQLAACLKAIYDVTLERDTAKEELLASYKERLAALRIEARKLQDAILAGQDNLPIEPPLAQMTIEQTTAEQPNA